MKTWPLLVIPVLVALTPVACPAQSRWHVIQRYPVPTSPQGAYAVPSPFVPRGAYRALVPQPETGDLARCLNGPPPPGAGPSDHGRLCEQMELGRRNYRWMESSFGSAYSGFPAPPAFSVPYEAVSPQAMQVHRLALVQAFPGHRAALFGELKPVFLDLDPTAIEYVSVSSRAKWALETVEAFRWRYWLVKDEPVILREFDQIDGLERWLQQLKAACDRGRTSAALAAHLSDPDQVRLGEGYANPIVRAANLKASEDRQRGAAKDAEQGLRAIREVLAAD